MSRLKELDNDLVKFSSFKVRFPLHMIFSITQIIFFKIGTCVYFHPCLDHISTWPENWSKWTLMTVLSGLNQKFNVTKVGLQSLGNILVFTR